MGPILYMTSEKPAVLSRGLGKWNLTEHCLPYFELFTLFPVEMYFELETVKLPNIFVMMIILTSYTTHHKKPSF